MWVRDTITGLWVPRRTGICSVIPGIAAASGGGTAEPLSIAAVDSDIITSPGSATVTHSGMSFGTPASNRTLIACIGADYNTAPTALGSTTIGGETATVVIERVVTSSGQERIVGIIIADVPNGTSGDVVYADTGSDTPIDSICQLYRATKIDSSSPASSSQTGSTSTVTFTSFNCADAVVSVAMSDGSLSSFSWTGITEAYDEQADTSTTASAYGESLGTNTVSCTPGTADISICIASWNEAT